MIRRGRLVPALAPKYGAVSIDGIKRYVFIARSLSYCNHPLPKRVKWWLVWYGTDWFSSGPAAPVGLVRSWQYERILYDARRDIKYIQAHWCARCCRGWATDK